jgi:hypothetical protein
MGERRTESNIAQVRRQAWRRVLLALAAGEAAAVISDTFLGLHLSIDHLERLRPVAAEAVPLAEQIGLAAESIRLTFGRHTLADGSGGGPNGMNTATDAAFARHREAGRRLAARLDELRDAHPELLGDLGQAAATVLRANP